MEFMNRRSVAATVMLTAIMLLLSACDLVGIGSESNQPAVLAGDDEAPLVADLGIPDGVAEAYLRSWQNGNYEAMYSFLTPNSQAEYMLEDFVDIHVSTADTMQARNTFEKPDAVQPAAFRDFKTDGDMLTVNLPAKSVVTLEIL